MTDTKDLRDEFAMAALTGICASITAGAGHEVFHGADGGIITADKYAALNAWAVADAMMAERGRKTGKYPECSGDPASCPENEGHGCCGRKA